MQLFISLYSCVLLIEQIFIEHILCTHFHSLEMHPRTKSVPWCFGVQTFLNLPHPLPGEFLARNPGGLTPLPCPSLVCSLGPLSPSPSVSQARVWGSYRIICPQGVLLPHLSGEMDWRATELMWSLREPVSMSGDTLG